MEACARLDRRPRAMPKRRATKASSRASAAAAAPDRTVSTGRRQLLALVHDLAPCVRRQPRDEGIEDVRQRDAPAGHGFDTAARRRRRQAAPRAAQRRCPRADCTTPVRPIRCPRAASRARPRRPPRAHRCARNDIEVFAEDTASGSRQALPSSSSRRAAEIRDACRDVDRTARCRASSPSGRMDARARTIPPAAAPGDAATR